MKALVSWIGLLIAAPAVAAGEPAAVATVSKTEVSVGEAFTVEVRASGPIGSTFAFPPALVRESLELGTAPPGQSPLPAGIHRYRAAVFAIGDVEVPPIPIRYRLADGTAGEVQTRAVPLHVVSLLPKAKDEQKLADVRGPVRLSVGRAFWIGLGALTLLVGALAMWLWSRRWRVAPAVATAPPSLEPDEEARQALAALAASGRLSRGEFRLFYIELTLIAKRYLERRLGAPIVEMTTAEMLSHLRATPHGIEMAPLLRDLSGAADRIKFALGSGLIEEAERHLAATRTLIDGLETRLAPAAVEGGRAA